MIDGLQLLFASYAADILSATPTFVDWITSKDLRDRKFVVGEATKLFDRLKQIIDRVQGRRGQRNVGNNPSRLASRENVAAIIRL